MVSWLVSQDRFHFITVVFQDHTLIGKSDAPTEQDIQLSGLGIMPEHCIIDIESAEVYVSPLEGAR